jgi:hypothetical protein
MSAFRQFEQHAPSAHITRLSMPRKTQGNGIALLFKDLPRDCVPHKSKVKIKAFKCPPLSHL